MIRWIFLLGLTCGAFGTHIHHQDCGNIHHYMLEDVYLDVPCPTQPCWLPLKRQTNTTIVFKSSQIQALDVTPKVYMKDGEAKKKIDTVPIKCPQHVCPIHPDENKGYSVLLKPVFTYPTTTVKIQLELFNQKEEQLLCVLFPARVYDPDLTKPTWLYDRVQD